MRVGVDASPIIGERGGVGWHTYNLLRALADLKEEVELICYVQPGSRLRGKVLEEWQRRSNLHWVASSHILMGWRGSLDSLDLYHGTNYKMRTTGRCGGIVTIHDLWLDRYPQYSKKLFGQRRSFHRTKRSAWKARKVITVSQHSARDIELLYGLPPERIVVIPNGVSDEFFPDADSSSRVALCRGYELPTDRFILFVGGADPRKNHRTLLEAYSRAASRLKDYTVVMVGDQEHRSGHILQSVKGFGLEHRVVCVGRASLVDLRRLYSNAEIFIFPSIYEGFGLPVLEAMACGAPVIASNSTSLPEVAGNAALLIDPKDPEAIADVMVRVLESQALRESLRTKGFERAKAFTWESTARRTMEVYRELCEG